MSQADLKETLHCAVVSDVKQFTKTHAKKVESVNWTRKHQYKGDQIAVVTSVQLKDGTSLCFDHDRMSDAAQAWFEDTDEFKYLALDLGIATFDELFESDDWYKGAFQFTYASKEMVRFPLTTDQTEMKDGTEQAASDRTVRPVGKDAIVLELNVKLSQPSGSTEFGIPIDKKLIFVPHSDYRNCGGFPLERVLENVFESIPSALMSSMPFQQFVESYLTRVDCKEAWASANGMQLMTTIWLKGVDLHDTGVSIIYPPTTRKRRKNRHQSKRYTFALTQPDPAVPQMTLHSNITLFCNSLPLPVTDPIDDSGDVTMRDTRKERTLRRDFEKALVKDFEQVTMDDLSFVDDMLDELEDVDDFFIGPKALGSAASSTEVKAEDSFKKLLEANGTNLSEYNAFRDFFQPTPARAQLVSKLPKAPSAACRRSADEGVRAYSNEQLDIFDDWVKSARKRTVSRSSSPAFSRTPSLSPPRSLRTSATRSSSPVLPRASLSPPTTKLSVSNFDDLEAIWSQCAYWKSQHPKLGIKKMTTEKMCRPSKEHQTVRSALRIFLGVMTRTKEQFQCEAWRGKKTRDMLAHVFGSGCNTGSTNIYGTSTRYPKPAEAGILPPLI